MSDKSTSSGKSNDVVINSKNCWIMRSSSSHPGQIYYFNTLTGVSVWNLSFEDMERAKQHMRTNENQSYICCPEPIEPPPIRKTSSKPQTPMNRPNTSQYSKIYNKQIINNLCPRPTSGLPSDVCYSAVNQLTLNFRPYPQSECYSSHNTASPQTQVQPACPCLNTAPLQTTIGHDCQKHLVADKCSPYDNMKQIPLSSKIEKAPIALFHNTGLKQLENNMSQTKAATEATAQIAVSKEHSSKQQDSEGCEVEVLDLAPIKLLTPGSVDGKYYLIADATVFLNDVAFLKSLLNSDQQCILMVTRNVLIKLENATKTDLRTKAYGAIHFIYKQLDIGAATIDENNDESGQIKSNCEYILECCFKIMNQNNFVFVISDDEKLKICREEIIIPIFTISEIKKYLYTNIDMSKKIPEYATSIIQKIKKFKASTSQCLIGTTISDKQPSSHSTQPSDITLMRNTNMQTTLNFNETKKINSDNSSIRMADAQVQTDLSLVQLAEMEQFYKNNQDNENYSAIDMRSSHLRGSTVCSNNKRVGKRIKLRRSKVNQQQISVNKIQSEPVNQHLPDTSDNKPKPISENNLLLNRIPTSTSFDSINPLKEKCIRNNMIAEKCSIKNVMFEITSKTMESNLKRKCDEWVSRFVQIVEEALSQVLRKCPSICLPPPWNMYEAIVCIGKIYNDDPDVTDAVQKLLNVLDCYEKGNIDINISPTKYMEMYSYGVYLIDALQGVSNTCEDIQIAAESLSKLLCDIQDIESSGDISQKIESLDGHEHNFNEIATCKPITNEIRSINNLNSVVDTANQLNDSTILSNASTESNEKKANNISKRRVNPPIDLERQNTDTLKYACKQTPVEIPTKGNISAVKSVTRSETASKNQNKTPVTSPCSHKLRSSYRKSACPTKSPERSASDDNDTRDHEQSSFLLNLSLKRLQGSERINLVENNKNLAIYDAISKNIQPTDNLQANKETNNASNSSSKNIINNEPKIIRNFVICTKLEDRIKNSRMRLESHDFEHLDLVDDGITEADYMDEVEDLNNTNLVNKISEMHGNTSEYKIERSNADERISLKYVMNRIAQEMKEISTAVYTFSENYCEGFISPVSDSDCLRVKAKQAHLYIDELCTALSGLLRREKNCNDNLQSILRNSEFGQLVLDDDQIEIYGNFVARCLEHACDLRDAVGDILNAIQD